MSQKPMTVIEYLKGSAAIDDADGCELNASVKRKIIARWEKMERTLDMIDKCALVHYGCKSGECFRCKVQVALAAARAQLRGD